MSDSALSAIDYTSRDFTSLRQSLLDYAAIRYPAWKPASEGDFGVILVELLAYMGDIMSYYVDRAQQEAYLPTATQRASVMQIAQSQGYEPNAGTPAQGTITLATTDPSDSVVLLAGTRVATDFVSNLDTQIIFETDYDVVVPGDGGEIEVDVTEGETRRNDVTGGYLDLGASTGLPNQTYRLPHPQVYTDTIKIFIEDEEWFRVDSLLDHTATERVFETRVDSTGYTWLRLGDGVNGDIPPLGLMVQTEYRTGVGAAGNVAAGKVATIFDQAVDGVSVAVDDTGTPKSSDMAEGTDPEDIESIRRNAPRAFNTQKRAVTVQDFTDLALTVPGVSKAKAVAKYFSSITVYVCGAQGREASDDLIETTFETLQSYALTGVTVTVSAASNIGINLGSSGDPVLVEVLDTYSRSSVQYQVERALEARFDIANVDLEDLITVSDIYRTVMSVEGVRFVDIPIMARVDSLQSGAAAIQLRTWQYPELKNLFITSSGGVG